MEEDRHGIFYSDSIDVFKGISNGGCRYFKFIFERFHGWNVCVALAPAVIIIRGSIFHPLTAILSINGLYLLFFASSVSGENLSLQYVTR
jgi:hypothetical protein